MPPRNALAVLLCVLAPNLGACGPSPVASRGLRLEAGEPPPGASPGSVPVAVAANHVDRTRPRSRLALVIGNDRYQHLPALGNAVRDAAAVATALRGAGFEVTEAYDLDRAATATTVAAFGAALAQAPAGAIALVYFAGHGFELRGTNYLVPISARLASRDDAATEAVRADELVAALGVRSGDARLVLLDACRTSPFGRAGGGLARMDAPAGTFVGFSTAPGKVAQDGAAGGLGPYASALSQRLASFEGPVELLFRHVRNDVLRATATSQLPWDSSALVGDDLCLRGACPVRPEARLGNETSLAELLRARAPVAAIRRRYAREMRRLEVPGPGGPSWHVLEEVPLDDVVHDVVVAMNPGPYSQRVDGEVRFVRFLDPDEPITGRTIDAYFASAARSCSLAEVEVGRLLSDGMMGIRCRFVAYQGRRETMAAEDVVRLKEANREGPAQLLTYTALEEEARERAALGGR